MAVAQRMYARALFEAAREEGRLEHVDDELADADGIVHQEDARLGHRGPARHRGRLLATALTAPPIR